MKNNPFVVWGLPETLINRKEEQKILLAFMDHIINGRSWTVIITGTAGSGKSTLLKWAQKEAEKRKCVVSFVTVPARSGKEFLLRELKAGISGLLKELEDKGEIKEGAPDNFAKKTASDFITLIRAAKKALEKRPLIFIIDDFGVAKNAQKILEEMNEAVEGQDGVGLLLSSSKKLVPMLGNMLVSLKEASEQDLFDYAAKTASKATKIGDECARAVYQDSGGNLRIIQFALWYLYENAREGDKIITRAHYDALRMGLLTALANEWFGRLYADASEEEKRVLKELAQAEQLSVTGLSRLLGKNEGPTATLLLRLMERGDVVKVKRGRYRLFAPLYASFILERSK